MRRVWLAIVFVLLGVIQVAAQDNVYALSFEYDSNNDSYYAEVEVDMAAGDTLEATVTGGEDVYFYVYTDSEDLYEGDSLADFVAQDDGVIYVGVESATEASGELIVVSGGEMSGATTPTNQTTSNMAASTVEAGDFAETDCPFEVPSGVRVTCGTLTVPENRQTDNGATIQLAVAVIDARSGNPLPDPIFYLEGGPGGSALAGVDSWFNSPYGEERDIVVFDQRGTGFSEPSLNCPEMDTDDSTDAVEACRDRLLAEGVDLTAYNSRENAADVEALRLALGYDQINLYGISYGTRLALTVMRDQPQGIRAVVIDSVYPPNIDTNYNVTTDTYQLISMMFADCAAQPDCAGAFPDLEARFYDQLDAIADNPPQVTNADGETVDLYPEDVINTLVNQLKDTALVSAIPASLDAFASGDYDTYMDLATNGAGTSTDGTSLAQELAVELSADELAQIQDMAAQNDTAGIADYLSGMFDLSAEEADQVATGFVQLGGSIGAVGSVEPPDIDDDSEGMNMSVQCNEEMPFMTLDEASARAEAVDMPDIVRQATFAVSQSEFDSCDVWPAGTADAIEDEPVVSDIPTLVLAAQYDTATPPWWADLAAETLSNSFDFHFPLVGHGVIDGGSCPISIGLAFLADPYSEPDTSCIAGMNDQFYVP
ncbi:MAG: alpha/beta fold hydrolase [Anaerolineaceae bacterium]|nr:alpha/beta fold hydrolase [Anaerolineaceae bacterium]